MVLLFLVLLLAFVFLLCLFLLSLSLSLSSSSSKENDAPLRFESDLCHGGDDGRPERGEAQRHTDHPRLLIVDAFDAASRENVFQVLSAQLRLLDPWRLDLVQKLLQGRATSVDPRQGEMDRGRFQAAARFRLRGAPRG